MTIQTATRREFIKLFNKLDTSKECWIKTNKNRYGYITFRGKTFLSHRFFYTQLVGAIPKGKVLDHTCRNTLCSNPNHLRVVSLRQNSLENSLGKAAENYSKVSCKHGHSFDPNNTIIVFRSNGLIERLCRTCHKRSNRLWYKNKKV